MQKRGKINLIGRLQLSTERSREEDNQSIVQLRILRVQVCVVQVFKYVTFNLCGRTKLAMYNSHIFLLRRRLSLKF